MRKNTKLFKIMKTIYDENKKINARELSELSGIKRKYMEAYLIRLSDYVKKEKINGISYYYIPNEHEKKYIRKMIMTAT